MARIFKDCLETVQSITRELKVSGITVPVKHYQSKELVGDDQNTKELIGVNFIISKPYLKKNEMIEYIFPNDSEKIISYCEQEILDRVFPEILNPGNSYKIRLDLWQQFMSKKDGEKFDYTYNERINNGDQLNNAIEALKDDPHSRRSIISIWDPKDSSDIAGFNTRVPCSISYQFLIRNNKLMVIYYIRSNDLLNHWVIDLYLCHSLQEYILNALLPFYPELKCGSLNYYAGSLHAYNADISKLVIF